MPTVAAGNTAEVYVPLASSVTITPGSSVRFGCSSPKDTAPAGRIIRAAETISIPAGSTVFIEAVGQDATYTGDIEMTDPSGSVVALTELAPGQVAVTVTATAFTGACDYAGFVVRAVSGTVNVTVYDATSATGDPIHTASAISLTGGNDGADYYGWAGNKVRINTTGCHVVIAGGGTCSLEFLVG